MNKEKKKLEKKADQLWHEAGIRKWGSKCFFTNSSKRAKNCQGKVRFGHHIKPKGLYYHLRYDLDNFLEVCWPCHYKLEKVDRSMILDVVARRKGVWYNRLEKKVKQRLGSSFKTIDWYQKQIEKLNENQLEKRKKKSKRFKAIPGKPKSR